MRRFLLIILSVPLIFILASTGVVLASDQFKSTMQVDYVFDAAGRPAVTQYISLTNRFSGVYASSYEFTVHGAKLDNISGSDRLGPLKITTTVKEPDITTVSVKFNEQVVGRGQTLTFSLSYFGEPATHHGQVWEISLPKLATQETFDSYKVNFTVPESFGPPAYIYPSPKSQENFSYHFDQTDTGTPYIQAAFGHLQSFAFNLKYDLDNTSIRPIVTFITLPPDTDYQHLYYSSMDPQPKNIIADIDGNWLAEYSLSPLQKTTVKVSGMAHIQPFPGRQPVNPSADNLASYLKPSAFWPVNDPHFADLAQKYKTPGDIYHYVVDTLSYDTNRITSQKLTRRGALTALQSPQNSICTDFTDLFITMARAAGIPARELNGYAYTTNLQVQPLGLAPDILHAWPEYWDPSQRNWVSVDPTWEKTTGGVDYFNQFDFNHFVFAIHGSSSTGPLSAGQFTADPQAKTVDVSVSPYTEFPTAALEFSWEKPSQFLPFFPNNSILNIKNPAGQAVYNIPVEVIAQNLSISSPKSAIYSVIPPLSQNRFPINFTPGIVPDFSGKYLAARVGDKHLTYNIPTNSFAIWYVGSAITIAALVISLAFLAEKAWSVYLQRQHQQNNIRRKSQKSA